MRTIPAKLRWLLVCCAMSVLLGTAGCRTNPVTGFLEFSLVGPDTELALGHQSHPSIIFMYDGEYRDPELNRYLGTIVMRLHACSHRPEMPTEFTMLSTSVVNAFATPGHVYATRGFLAKLENEAQFSSVMGHELAHVTAGHPAKQMTHRLLTGLAFGVADFAVGDTTVGQVAVGLGQASVALLGLSYSREQERQADRVGTYYMALAGWDARQAIAMQRLLASLNARKETILDRYLSTHPAADDRVAKIQGVLEERGLASARYIQGDGIYADRWNRRLAPLRQADEAFATYDRGVKLMAEKKYGEALASANEAISLQAGRAQFHRLKGDALIRLVKPSQAEGAYRESLRLDPRYVPANIGLGVSLFDQGKFAAAETQFATAARGLPGSLAAWYGLGMARYKQESYATAIEPLEKAAGALPNEPDIHYTLAVCYDKTGQATKAYRSYVRALNAGLKGPERQRAEQRVQVLRPRSAA